MVLPILLRTIVPKAVKFIPKVVKGFFGTPAKAIGTLLVLPGVTGFLTTKEGRAIVKKFVDPRRRFEFGQKLPTDPIGAVRGIFEKPFELPPGVFQSFPVETGLMSVPVPPPPKTKVEKVKEIIADVIPDIPPPPAVPSFVVPAALGGAIAALTTFLIQRGGAPAGLLPAPPSLTPTTQPLGAVQPPIEPREITPSITNTFNPTIDIRFSKRKQFINQQILIRNR